MSRLKLEKNKVLLGIEPRSPASETSVITTTLQNLLVHIVNRIIQPITCLSMRFDFNCLYEIRNMHMVPIISTTYTDLNAKISHILYEAIKLIIKFLLQVLIYTFQVSSLNLIQTELCLDFRWLLRLIFQNFH